MAARAPSRGPREILAVAAELGATPAQVALAWLLDRSPVMLPIPGTASIAHLEENVAAVSLRMSHEQWRDWITSCSQSTRPVCRRPRP